MEYKTLPLGTVIRINDAKAIIVGYDFDESDNKLSREYVVLPYPKGYSNPNDLKIVSGDDFEVIQRGYENEYSHAAALYIDGIEHFSEQMTADELMQAISEAVTDNTKSEV